VRTIRREGRPRGRNPQRLDAELRGGAAESIIPAWCDARWDSSCQDTENLPARRGLCPLPPKPRSEAGKEGLDLSRGANKGSLHRRVLEVSLGRPSGSYTQGRGRLRSRILRFGRGFALRAFTRPLPVFRAEGQAGLGGGPGDAALARD